MAVNEQIVTGRKFRKLVDEATKLWQRISFWTKASDVEFDDGSTAETKMGAINGITDSLVSTSSNIAASAKALSTLNNNLGGIEFIFDESGKITGYKSKAGADTVHPFTKTAKYHVQLNWWNGEINPSEQIAVTIFNENNQQVLRMSGNFSYSTWQQDRYFDVTV